MLFVEPSFYQTYWNPKLDSNTTWYHASTHSNDSYNSRSKGNPRCLEAGWNSKGKILLTTLKRPLRRSGPREGRLLVWRSYLAFCPNGRAALSTLYMLDFNSESLAITLHLNMLVNIHIKYTISLRFHIALTALFQRVTNPSNVVEFEADCCSIMERPSIIFLVSMPHGVNSSYFLSALLTTFTEHT